MAGKIILIESDVVLSAVLEEVLRHSGYTVMIVGTSKGELGLIHSASAVILDLDTTAADRELARLSLLQLRREALPIVLMGVQIPESLHQRLRSHSARLQSKHVVWVQKPFRNEELLAAVRQAQEGCVSGQVNGNKLQALWGEHDAPRDRRRP
jgi:DNA-binding response OmpR family regulator